MDINSSEEVFVELVHIEKLEDIEKRILETAENLKSSRWEPRTLQSIHAKKRILKDDFKTFESIISKYEFRLATEEWNQLTDKLTSVKSKYDFCIKILNYTPIKTDKVYELRHRTIIVNEPPKTIRGGPSILDRSISDPELSTVNKEEDPEFLSSTLLEVKQSDTDLKQLFTNDSVFDEGFEFTKLDLHDFSVKFQTIYEKHLSEKENKDISIMALNDNNNNNNQAQVQNHLNMQLAIQCIPEFHGSVDELEPFLVQIKYFAEQHPDADSQKQLLNIVLMKLKGKAATFINRIKSETWAEMLPKLRSTFSKVVSAEEILQKIETLEQGFKESFTDYADRALRIQEYVEQLQEGQQQPQQQAQQQPAQITVFAERSLRIHFIGGLRNANLKQVAKAQKVSSFKELIQILELEHKECEQLEYIEQRLQTCRMTKSQQYIPNQRSGQRNFNNYDRNQNFSNNYTENRNRNFNNSNNQRSFNNSRSFMDNARPTNSGASQNRNNFNPSQTTYNNYQHRGYNQNHNLNQQSQGPSNWNNRRFDNQNERSQNNYMNFNQRKN